MLDAQRPTASNPTPSHTDMEFISQPVTSIWVSAVIIFCAHASQIAQSFKSQGTNNRSERVGYVDGIHLPPLSASTEGLYLNVIKSNRVTVHCMYQQNLIYCHNTSQRMGHQLYYRNVVKNLFDIAFFLIFDHSSSPLFLS